MSCLSGDCGSWSPPIITPEIPIRGGWYLIGLPPCVPENLSKHHVNRRFTGSTHNEAIASVAKILRNNDVQSCGLTELREWATNQWVGRDPKRSKYPNACSPEFIDFSKEAKKFWENWNRRFSDQEQDLGLLMAAFIADAKSFIASPKFGCPDYCAKNFPKHLEAYPPENVATMLHAQVWLWKIHNLTREGMHPTPYGDVARKFQWPVMADVLVAEYLKELEGG